jgi:poly-beta-1,6-N-acetyl-D-glucosamine synthase
MYFHHRQMGTAQQGVLAARFKDGVKDYAVGSHPVWEVFRTIYQMTKRPFIVGGMALLSGYVWSVVRGVQRPVSEEMVVFHRHEQMTRLKEFLGGKTLRRA